MSFFQLLTNAYVPYNHKQIFNNFDASFINSAYNASHDIIGKTLDKSTKFRRKSALETMLFLLAIGLKQLGAIKKVNNESLSEPAFSISMSLTGSLNEELYNNLINEYNPIEDFLLSRIETYIEMLEKPNLNFQTTLIVLLLEKPLSLIEKEMNLDEDSGYYTNEYFVDRSNSQVAKDLGLILQIQPLIAEATLEMRKSINKMY